MMGKQKGQLLQKLRRILVVTKRFYYIQKANHLLAESGNDCINIEFSNYCVHHAFLLLSKKDNLCTRGIRKTPWVYKRDAACTHMTPEQHIFTLPTLALILNKKNQPK